MEHHRKPLAGQGQSVSKRASLYLIRGGLKQEERGIYRLRERWSAPAAETWPRDGEWRRLIHSLIGNPIKRK